MSHCRREAEEGEDTHVLAERGPALEPGKVPLLVGSLRQRKGVK